MDKLSKKLENCLVDEKKKESDLEDLENLIARQMTPERKRFEKPETSTE
jgi:hypothetical protein